MILGVGVASVVRLWVWSVHMVRRPSVLSVHRFLLIGGSKGHIATMDWKDKQLGCEFHVRETVRDVQ